MSFTIAPVSRKPKVPPLDQIKIDRLNILIEPKRPKHSSMSTCWLSLLRQVGIDEEHSSTLLKLFMGTG